MALFNVIQNMIDAGTGQLVTWVTGILPQVFLFLILLNALGGHGSSGSLKNAVQTRSCAIWYCHFYLR